MIDIIVCQFFFALFLKFIINDLKEIKERDPEFVSKLNDIGQKTLNDTLQKINNFIRYNELEKDLPDNRKDNYYYKIVSDNSFVGIIGFHKFGALKNNNFYLTIFINPESQGSGLFSQSLKLLVKKMKKHKPYLNKLTIWFCGFFKLNSSTLASSGVIVAHLTPTLYFFNCFSRINSNLIICIVSALNTKVIIF